MIKLKSSGRSGGRGGPGRGGFYCREQPVSAILPLCSAHRRSRGHEGAKIKPGAEKPGANSESEGARADKGVPPACGGGGKAVPGRLDW